MTFPYYQVCFPTELTSTYATRALDMARREVSERAAILMRLGYAQSDVAARIKSYVAWEHSVAAGKPAVAAEVDALVAAAFSHKPH
jgi:hypothetical protein